MAGQEGESSPTLEGFVGDAFGDLPEEAEPGQEDTTGVAESEPSQEHPTSPEATPTPEGTDKAERAGEPPKAAAEATPDKAGEPAKPDDDPLKSATPFTYVVNGETRTYDGIKVLGTDGAIIDADKLEDLQRRLGERDYLYETNKTLYESQKSLERLSEWKVKGQDGQERTLQGREGLEAMRVENAQKEASLNALASIFQRDQQGNYPNFAKLVTVVEGPNGQLLISPDQEFLNNLIRTSDQAEKIAAYEVRETLSKLAAPVTSTSSAPDYTAQAPQMIEAAAKAAGVDLKVLTDRDKGFLASQFPRYIRPATIADERANPTDPRYKVGSSIVDASFTQLVKEKATDRTEVSKSVLVTQTATRENAARLAAAARGTRTQPAPTTTQRKRTEPSERATDADKGFDLISNLTSPKRVSAG